MNWINGERDCVEYYTMTGVKGLINVFIYVPSVDLVPVVPVVEADHDGFELDKDVVDFRSFYEFTMSCKMTRVETTYAFEEMFLDFANT